jgi:hypothetical protein
MPYQASYAIILLKLLQAFTCWCYLTNGLELFLILSLHCNNKIQARADTGQKMPVNQLKICSAVQTNHLNNLNHEKS